MERFGLNPDFPLPKVALIVVRIGTVLVFAPLSFLAALILISPNFDCGFDGTECRDVDESIRLALAFVCVGVAFALAGIFHRRFVPIRILGVFGALVFLGILLFHVVETGFTRGFPGLALLLGGYAVGFILLMVLPDRRLPKALH